MPEVIVRTLNVDVKLKSEADVGLQEDVDPGISAGAMHDWEGRNLIENRNVWCKRSPALDCRFPMACSEDVEIFNEWNIAMRTRRWSCGQINRAANARHTHPSSSCSNSPQPRQLTVLATVHRRVMIACTKMASWWGCTMTSKTSNEFTIKVRRKI